LAVHSLTPDRQTLHGHFSRDLPPVLTINSGDTVRFRLLDARWQGDAPEADGGGRYVFEPRVPELDKGHALCGPIEIRGAEPGMTLEVEIGELRTGSFGWTVAGNWASPLNTRLGLDATKRTMLEWALDPTASTARDQRGRVVKMLPFLGVIGMPPAEPGVHPTAPPRPTGGNIDCKELVTGSRLFLPIVVPGGFVSAGDGHGRQGDGESSGTAIECPMDAADLTFLLHPEMTITTPRAETAEGWLTFGFDEDLDEAMAIALDAMLDLMGEKFVVDRVEAMALASVVVDLRITQVVNGVRGVHAVLPHDALS
jgi:acetamidase/formamidase